MVNVGQVITGLKKYLDSELLSKINGWQKWIAGATVSMAMEKSVDIFNSLKTNPAVKALNIITSDDLIDIDTLYKYILEESKKTAATFTLPVIGAVTLRSEDVEKLYTYITGA